MSARLPPSVSTNLAIRGALIEESYRYLQSCGQSKSDDRLRHSLESVPLHGSESWRTKVKDELRRRFDPDGAERGLARLASADCPLPTWTPLLLWHLARKDRLLYDFLTNWLYPQFRAGAVIVRAPELWPYLEALPSRGLLSQQWSQKTISRVASQLLHVASDFGLMRGKITREFVSYHLPDESFLYLLHAMTELQPNAREVVRSTDWHLFLMDADDVERELFRLHQFRRVHYEVAGSLAQLKLPCESAADYAWKMAA